MRLTLAHWVDDQKEFFARRARSEEAKMRRLEAVIKAGVLSGLAVAFSLGIILAIPNPLGRMLHGWLDQVSWGYGALLVGTGLPLIGATLLHAYAQTRALTVHARQYRIMEDLFTTARQRLESLLPTGAAGQQQLSELRRLLEELGREALVENADWVLLHRDRPLEVPHGR